MVARVSWGQALAWRMRRQLLDPVGTGTTADVVRRLCGVQAQVGSTAELAVRVRRTASKPGDVARALSQGRLIKTWAMRGTLHLLTPEDGGAFLSLIAAGRSWDRPSWQSYFGITPAQLEALRAVVREALDGTALTREELVGAVIARRGFGHVGDALRSGWGTLLKPLAWQGDLCFGPNQGTRVTFMRPEDASSRWAGVPEPAEAASVAISAYLRSHGPATVNGFANWLSRGRTSKQQLRRWFDDVRPRLAEVEVDGERSFVLAKDLDDLVATKPTRAVRPAAGLRPVRDGTGDGGPARDPGAPAIGGEHPERLDPAGRHRRRRRARDVGARRRRHQRRVGQRRRCGTPYGAAGGGSAPLDDRRAHAATRRAQPMINEPRLRLGQYSIG